jgi:hypothetical protein
MTSTKLTEALRRRFKSPRDVLLALGLDEALAQGEGNPKKMPIADLVQITDYLVACGMPSDEVEQLRQSLAKYAESDRPADDNEEETEESSATSGGLNLRRDKEDAQKAMEQAMWRRQERERRERETRVALATDSTAARSFFEQFPEAKHIGLA